METLPIASEPPSHFSQGRAPQVSEAPSHLSQARLQLSEPPSHFSQGVSSRMTGQKTSSYISRSQSAKSGKKASLRPHSSPQLRRTDSFASGKASRIGSSNMSTCSSLPVLRKENRKIMLSASTRTRTAIQGEVLATQATDPFLREAARLQVLKIRQDNPKQAFDVSKPWWLRQRTEGPRMICWRG
mmetsp:Transcript_53677/g.96500  ORF Transcript_53677/g.96500 Transcript_53677/m.96500 type:complete len:186 (+) Transcript_53677:35-592(+)